MVSSTKTWLLLCHHRGQVPRARTPLGLTGFINIQTQSLIQRAVIHSLTLRAVSEPQEKSKGEFPSNSGHIPSTSHPNPLAVSLQGLGWEEAGAYFVTMGLFKEWRV